MTPKDDDSKYSPTYDGRRLGAQTEEVQPLFPFSTGENSIFAFSTGTPSPSSQGYSLMAPSSVGGFPQTTRGAGVYGSDLGMPSGELIYAPRRKDKYMDCCC